MIPKTSTIQGNVLPPVTIKKLLILNILDMFGLGITAPIFAFIFSVKSDIGIFTNYYTPTQLTFLYGLLIGCFSVGSIIGSPLLGAVSDRIGRKPVLKFSFTVIILCFFLMLCSTHYKFVYGFFIARFLQGLLGTTQTTFNAVIADISTPENKSKNLGIIGVAFGIGLILGIICIFTLSQFSWFSYAIPFGIALAVAIISRLFLQATFAETLAPNALQKTKKIHLFTGFKNIKKGFTHPQLKILFVITFLTTIGFVFFSQFFQYYLISKFDFGITQVSTVFIYSGVCVAIAQGAILPLITAHFNALTILKFGIIAFAISFLILLLPQKAAHLYFVLPLTIALQGVCFPVLLSFISSHLPHHQQGELMGINQSVQALANAVPPIILSLAVAFSHNFCLYFAAFTNFIAWIILMLYYTPKIKKYK